MRILSVFRGSYKTTILIGFVIYLFVWSIVTGKEMSICYNTATKDNAESFMDHVRGAMLECKLLHKIFPELPTKESEFKRFTLKTVIFKNFQFDVASLDTKQVGRHYKIIINDDLVDDDNAYSEKERKTIMRKWRFQKSILTRYKKYKVGLELEVGTPYHSLDLMSYLVGLKEGELGADVKKFIVPYALPDHMGRYDLHERLGVLTFPEMFTWDDFLLTYKTQGSLIFGSQYELKVLPESDVLCKEEWLRYWTILPENYRRYMIVDPAGTENMKQNCPTGIIISDVNEAGTIFMLYASEHWVTTMGLVSLMKELKEEFDPDEIYMEREKYSISIADTLEHLQDELEFEMISHDNEPKPKRIYRTRQKWNTGRILLGEGMDVLAKRATTYPDCEYHELLDCIGHLVKKMDPPPRGRKRDRYREKAEDEFEKEVKKIMATQNAGIEEARLNDSFF